MLVITIVNKDIHHILKMRLPSEDLNIRMYNNGSNVLNYRNSNSALHGLPTIHTFIELSVLLVILIKRI